MPLELGTHPKAAQIAEALVNVWGWGLVTCVRGSFGSGGEGPSEADETGFRVYPVFTRRRYV